MSITTNPWTRPGHVVDIFFDFEFMDQCDRGLHRISLGAVVVGAKCQKTFYGVFDAFFKTPQFIDLCSGRDSNSEWMLANVLRHITGKAIKGNMAMTGSVQELSPKLADNWKFVLDYDQKYPILNADNTETPGNDPDIVIIGSDSRIFDMLAKCIDDCRRIDKGEDNEVRLWGYWPASDLVCLTNMVGGMMNLPESWKAHPFDLRTLSEAFGYQHSDFDCLTPHHALSDALAQYKTTQKLRTQIQKDYGTKLVPEGEW